MNRFKVVYSDGEDRISEVMDADSCAVAWEIAAEKAEAHTGGNWFPIHVQEVA